MLNDIINNILNKVKVNRDVEYVNNYINKLIIDLYCYEKINYLINNKGKHIRSLLALYYFYKYKINNSYNVDKLYKILAIVELTHFASLLHDDVIDNSKSRRSEYSFNNLYGNKNSILIGDYLLINTFNNLLKILDKEYYGKYITNQFIKASSDTAYGAYLENNLNNNDIKFFIEKYIKIARLKTGSLFKFACISGCILSSTSFSNVKRAASFGLVFGIIYQIQNDLDNYKCNSYKDSEDYLQSNITFPIIILNNINNIQEIFYSKDQQNFHKIQNLINTNEFKQIVERIKNKLLFIIQDIM